MISHWRTIVASLLLLSAGCSSEPAPPPKPVSAANPNSGYGVVDHNTIRFVDNAQSNAATNTGVEPLKFIDIQGNEVSLQDYLGKKHVVLVVTRGYAGSICVYCSTQTSRLLNNYAKFTERDAEIVVVFPVATPADSNRQTEFVASVKDRLDIPTDKIPFPIVLDISLKAVDQLGIRKDLSKPATYILDKEGQTRFAYVGESLADRPSVQALLDQLDLLQKDAAPKNEPANEATSEPKPTVEQDS